MISHKLSQIYKQYPCSILSFFVDLYETRCYQYNYFLYYRPSIIDSFSLRPLFFKITCSMLTLYIFFTFQVYSLIHTITRILPCTCLVSSHVLGDSLCAVSISEKRYVEMLFSKKFQ